MKITPLQQQININRYAVNKASPRVYNDIFIWKLLLVASNNCCHEDDGQDWLYHHFSCTLILQKQLDAFYAQLLPVGFYVFIHYFYDVGKHVPHMIFPHLLPGIPTINLFLDRYLRRLNKSQLMIKIEQDSNI